MAIKNTIKRWIKQGKEGLEIASDYAYSKYKKYQWKDFDAKSAAEGLEKLKSKEGFNKLAPGHQRKLIDDYIKGRSTIK